MLHPAFPILLIAVAAPAAAALGGGAGQRDGTLLAQMTIHERVIIRLPLMGAARAAIPAPVRYKEKKGPKCVAAADLGGALIQTPGAVDLVMNGGKRLRARLDKDCGPLDYYGGFYLRPAADGQVCAGRDVIRMRSGASCGIATFKTLVPAK
ncbi:hypothetical protein [Sphingomonas sp. 2SG]|uniref:hypothetical protein n=1 Tax=Sphingomonas sp. 2SG TaxID=2502201 RepID=UPI0010F626E4|nr:hypothetical protein [Sphingomonas sp. 2SG]